MTTLYHPRDEWCATLRPHTTIGRSRTSDLRVLDDTVSSQHALIVWTGDGWEIRDLNSRNGTFLDGSRVGPGERRRLSPGGRVRFGEVDGFVLQSGEPPVARAIPADGGPVVRAVGGLIALPAGVEPPEVTVYADGEGAWWVERGGTSERAGGTVVVDGVPYRLELPEHLPETRDVAVPTVDAITLEFTVSRDEEHTDVTVIHGERSLPLRPRVHHYLLVTLARERLRDADAGLPPASCGWVDHVNLAQMLGIAEVQVNIQVHRARNQLAEAGVADAARLVERREGARQLRIGVPALAVRVA